MRVVAQRVSSASVAVAGKVVGKIGHGLLLLVGVTAGDTETDGAWLAGKLVKLRIFPDEAGQMNRSVVDVSGGILVVSQFTLYASTQKGTRPSFNAAAAPDIARALYETFVGQVGCLITQPVQTGAFGEMMDVALVNHGPVTILLDSQRRE
ncbi:MAG: D-aminoacyl-tRNA deacylase [Candidatus Didemnitutus sp.]|nr:D-aminoacyl-tRNA deacylase [Candidatus Didemnitutus sp.]